MPARLPTRHIVLATLLTVTAGRAPARAQARADIGLLIGSTKATNEGGVLQFNRGTTYQATFAWRVWPGDRGGFSIEVPFVASPAFPVSTPGVSLPLEYASLYLTPGARLTVAPNRRVSFFGALGGGYARYSESKLRADRSPNPNQRDTNTGAFDSAAGST
jgi:hypothetical protein